MHFESGEAYHIYNRGNEKQPIFFSEKNYLFFLQKVRMEWLPFSDILAYTLMPNHFHFIIVPNKNGCRNIILKERETHMQELSKIIGKTLSSYTQAINIEQKRTGNLFQKKTKAKCLTDFDERSINPYLVTSAHYIHNNAYAANLVSSPFQWDFSSLKDYAGLRNGTVPSMNQNDLKDIFRSPVWPPVAA